jgi:PBP1b-binding outer membrane lipoprotein LpoB
MKPSMCKKLLLGLLLFGALLLSGCFTADVDDSQIPWGRPADFENQQPALGI